MVSKKIKQEKSPLVYMYDTENAKIFKTLHKHSFQIFLIRIDYMCTLRPAHEFDF